MFSISRTTCLQKSVSTWQGPPLSWVTPLVWAMPLVIVTPLETRSWPGALWVHWPMRGQNTGLVTRIWPMRGQLGWALTNQSRAWPASGPTWWTLPPRLSRTQSLRRRRTSWIITTHPSRGHSQRSEVIRGHQSHLRSPAVTQTPWWPG